MELVQAGSILVNSHIQLGHWREAEELFEVMLTQQSQKLQIDALNGLGTCMIVPTVRACLGTIIISGKTRLKLIIV
jgi:pentatricopeptide repeat protein